MYTLRNRKNKAPRIEYIIKMKFNAHTDTCERFNGSQIQND